MAEIDFAILGPQLQILLKDQAMKFVAGHATDVVILGQDVVQAVLSTVVAQHFEQIAPLSDNPTLDDLVNMEAVLTARTAAFQLVAQAEMQHAERIAKLKADAWVVAKYIGTTAISIVGGLAAKMLFGGMLGV